MIKGIVAAGTLSVMVFAAVPAAAASLAAAPPPPTPAPVTAYVVNFESGTVTPIRTANNTTGAAPAGRSGSARSGSRSRSRPTARSSTS